LTSADTDVAEVAHPARNGDLPLCPRCGEPCALPSGWHILCAPPGTIDEGESRH
jgi:hypothetical protein